MSRQVSVNTLQVATVPCDRCGNSSVINVSKFMDPDKPHQIKCKCRCGNEFSVSLERRRFPRKKVGLFGVLTQQDGKQAVTNPLVKIEDLSYTGLRFRLLTEPEKVLEAGDRAVIRFLLKLPGQKLLVVRNIVIRNRKGPIIGAEFQKRDPYDEPIGFFVCRTESAR